MSRLGNLNPYDLHKFLVNEYLLTTRGATNVLSRDTSSDKRDIDVIKEHHRFLWSDEEADSWEKQLAKKYYDKLFKEYCICDLSKYKENKVALRWRIEKEVISGKGQFVCGTKTCNIQEELRSWEVNFSYVEHGEKKNALVKLRLCKSCSNKLNYHTKKREVKKSKKKKKKSPKKPMSTTSVPETPEIEPLEIEEEPSSSRTNHEKTGTSEEPWKKTTIIEEKTREEEFEEYLEDLLL